MRVYTIPDTAHYHRSILGVAQASEFLQEGDVVRVDHNTSLFDNNGEELDFVTDHLPISAPMSSHDNYFVQEAGDVATFQNTVYSLYDTVLTNQNSFSINAASYDRWGEQQSPTTANQYYVASSPNCVTSTWPTPVPENTELKDLLVKVEEQGRLIQFLIDTLDIKGLLRDV